jgi:hypothetical protein
MPILIVIRHPIALAVVVWLLQSDPSMAWWSNPPAQCIHAHDLGAAVLARWVRPSEGGAGAPGVSILESAHIGSHWDSPMSRLF